MAKEKELQVRGQRDLAAPTEPTRPVPVFTPAVDIYETDKELVLLADMPGVDQKNLNIDLHEDVLTIVGDVDHPEGAGETVVMKEYRTGRFYRQFTLTEVVDREKIDAVLKDGVLTLHLPKAEKAQPRKIQVKSA